MSNKLKIKQLTQSFYSNTVKNGGKGTKLASKFMIIQGYFSVVIQLMIFYLPPIKNHSVISKNLNTLKLSFANDIFFFFPMKLTEVPPASPESTKLYCK